MADQPYSPPPQYTPDGRFWWNGQQWMPVVPPPWAYRKSPTGYVIASVFIPGLGSLLLQRWKWGAAILGTTLACWIAYFIVFATSFSSVFSNFHDIAQNCSANTCSFQGFVGFPSGLFIAMAIIGPIGFAAWIAGIVDAVRGTHQWNRARGLPE